MTTELKVVRSGRYPIGEAARAMGVNRSTVRRWVEQGMLRCGFYAHNRRRFITGEELLRFYNKTILG